MSAELGGYKTRQGTSAVKGELRVRPDITYHFLDAQHYKPYICILFAGETLLMYNQHHTTFCMHNNITDPTYLYFCRKTLRECLSTRAFFVFLTKRYV